MVTTRRSSNSTIEAFTTNNSSVALLEREIPSNYNEYLGAEARLNEVDVTEEKERRQKNLEKLLNYDRYSETYADAPAVDYVEKVETVDMSEEDIRPTSTTMQFGDEENLEKIYNEMKAVEKGEEVSYRLNGRGKFVVVMYALAITVIMALIILNTSILSVLSRQNAQKSADLQNVMNEYSSINTEIQEKTSNDYVIGVAENEYGMSIR